MGRSIMGRSKRQIVVILTAIMFFAFGTLLLLVRSRSLPWFKEEVVNGNAPSGFPLTEVAPTPSPETVSGGSHESGPVGKAEPPEPAAARQGSNCAPYKLPPGAEIRELGSSEDENRITIVYRAPSGEDTLIVPYDAIAATCVDPLIHGVVAHVHEQAREMHESRCKFVGDLLAGRTQLPPGKGDNYNLEYAEEWYRKECR